MSGAAVAETTCCSHCGGGNVRRVCRAIRTTKAIDVNCWDVAEEEIAVPRARGLLACNCGSAGGNCCASGTCGRCISGGCSACGKVRPRNRLMRKTFLEEVPVIVWGVEDTCADCAGHGGQVHCTTPARHPHFFDEGAPSPPPVPDLTAVFISDLGDSPSPERHKPSPLDGLLQTLQGSMQRK
jgi:hypothetical protein